MSGAPRSVTAREQLVHEGILGAPQGHGVEPGCGQEGGRIDRARMGHVEDEGDRLRRRFGDDEGGIELVDDGWTHQDTGCFGDEAGARISVRHAAFRSVHDNIVAKLRRSFTAYLPRSVMKV